MNDTVRAPDWSLEPLEGYIGRAERLTTVVRLSVQGMSMVQGAPKAMKAVSKATQKELDDNKFNSATNDAKFVKNEISEGFPVVYGQGVISLWSLLELAIKDLVAVWIKNKTELLLQPPMQNLKMRIGDYLSADEDEKYLFFSELLEREIGSGIKHGVNRFESLIEVVGLSGEIPKEMQKAFYEFGQIRNALAHQGNRVDRKLTNSCPWLKLQVGQELKVNAEMFQKYHLASLSYVTLIICRTGSYFDVDMSNDMQDIFDAYSA